MELGTGNYIGGAHCKLAMLDHGSELSDFKKCLADYGFTISALSCHGNPLHPDPGRAKQSQEVSRKTILLPFVPDGGLIDGKYPVSGGGTIFGSLGRNILRGPDQRDFDIAVIKTTPLTERVKLIFRWEIFNLLNRSNFANPSNDVSTPSTFGVISALTVNPRIMQYALKLEF